VLSDSARAVSGTREALCDTLRTAETAAPLRMSLGAVLLQPWFIYYQKSLHLIIFVSFSHKIRLIILWYALFKSLYIYQFDQSGCRWCSPIIGGAPGLTH
jgi:hypothetical protein